MGDSARTIAQYENRDTLLLLAVAATSEDLPPGETNGILNGRVWITFSEEQKTAYMWGFQNGMSESIKISGFMPLADLTTKRARVVAAGSHAMSFQPAKSTNAEIIAGVNEFYRDPVNLLIPATGAMTYFRKKVNGASPDALAEFVASLRRDASR